MTLTDSLGFRHKGQFAMATDVTETEDRNLRLSMLLEKKRRYEEKRNKLAIKMEQLDCKITETQADYGTIYNREIPILKLPTEVACIIFYYASGYPNEGDGESGRHLLIEVVISHVCHRWRSISIDYPWLWARFCFDGPNATRFPLDRLEAYLERSGTQKLELWFDFCGTRNGPGRGSTGVTGVNYFILLEKAILHVSRWYRVTINSDAETPITPVTSSLESSSAPNLVHFAFCPDILQVGENEGVESLEPTIFKGGAPKLRSLMIDSSSALVCLPPLSNVTILRIEAGENNMEYLFPWSTFYNILTLPALTGLSIVGNIFQTPENSITPIKMPSLRHLRYSDNELLARVLPKLRGPLLESLVIQNARFPERYSAFRAPPYVFPSLQCLCLIQTTTSSPRSAWYFAQMTRSITHAIFSHDSYVQSIFYMLLNGPDGDKKYWPKLERLTFNLPIGDEVSDALRFVQARPSDALVLEVFDQIRDQWRASDLNSYKSIMKASKLEIMDSNDDSLWRAYWPPGEEDEVDLTMDSDPFDIPASNFYLF
ncbi:hypothetical protein CPB84DRAFT_1797851 [Gymnopilus junonius]|uniref:F-box domain-containing protein n=1 Tax=Gymnopilus junonius TaxID=109634 RepID=A0A9P5N9H5_GYMJU|nr:hypothetical protein CPB84DRAFT_1797851 [Gymnopilus junonius]